MGINIRQKGQEGEREVAKALNSIISSILEKYNLSPPPVPYFQRNQNQSAVGGSDLTNPFGLAIEVKRQEQISINTWWKQCIVSAKDTAGIPILVYRKNKMSWRVIMLSDLPLEGGAHVCNVRCELEWTDFLQWFYTLAERRLRNGEWNPQ